MYNIIANLYIIAAYNNMIEWLHQVATDFPLPCHAFPTGLRRQILKCCYHSLQDDELHKFMQHLQMKLMKWGAACVGLGLSGGAAIMTIPKGGGGVTTFVSIAIGPFLD